MQASYKEAEAEQPANDETCTSLGGPVEKPDKTRKGDEKERKKAERLKTTSSQNAKNER